MTMSEMSSNNPEDTAPMGHVDVIWGLQRGDEGKGRFVDMLAGDYEMVGRFNGGDNAGHTTVLPDGRILKTHLVPSGIAHEGIVNVIGNGTLVNPGNLLREIDSIEEIGIEVSKDNLKISSGAHLILPHHILADEMREKTSRKQGSTKSGIAPVAASKAMREGLRVELINNEPEEIYQAALRGLMEYAPLLTKLRARLGLGKVKEQRAAEAFVEKACQIGAFVTDTVYYVNDQLEAGQNLLAEAAQAFLLDQDHGMYPFTTSSNTVPGGASLGLGFDPHRTRKIVGVTKATQSHVGGGPFVTEINDQAKLETLHGDMNTVDAEVGTTTGRVRRLGALDIPQLRRANRHGTTEMALTKLDWVPRYGSEVEVCVNYTRKGKDYYVAPDSARKLEECTPHYITLPTWEEDIQDVRHFEDLPKNAQRYVQFIEQETGKPITMIGVGPNRDQVIVRD